MRSELDERNDDLKNREEQLSVREKDYVEAAQSLGASAPTIMIRHVLPNILGPIIVAETLTIPAYISYEAFLSFPKTCRK